MLLTIHAPSGEFHLAVAPGLSIREALDTTEFRVRAACGGTGSCGACQVKLLGGEVSPPSLAEYMKLLPEERAAGIRLACQLRLRGDAEIQLDDPAPPSEWKSLLAENLAPLPLARPELTEHIYGLAVDLGTTHIRLALWDRKHGKRIATRHGPNPQGMFGADILNRLDAARHSPERAAELAELARKAILHGLRDILARDVGEVTPMLAQVGQVLIVGNTAMLALLTGQGGAALVDPDNWQRAIDCRPPDRQAWQQAWHMPNARVSVAAPAAGFIGSDLLADLLATGLGDGPPGSMLLDVGTNTEIALWDGQCFHLASVPGGPAFEGGGIRHGMSAEPGAIFRVHPGPTGFALETIGALPARGLCGSGLVDAIAALLAAGQLKPSGRFATSPGPEGYRLAADNPRTAIAGSDIDAFQRVKAATATAMALLLRGAGLGWRDLGRLCVCGAFGRHLDVARAQAVGLLPPIDPARIELYADASLTGCEIGLLDADGSRRFADLASKTRSVNLLLALDYEESYIDHLRLRPIDLDKQ